MPSFYRDYDTYDKCDLEIPRWHPQNLAWKTARDLSDLSHRLRSDIAPQCQTSPEDQETDAHNLAVACSRGEGLVATACRRRRRRGSKSTETTNSCPGHKLLLALPLRTSQTDLKLCVKVFYSSLSLSPPAHPLPRDKPSKRTASLTTCKGWKQLPTATESYGRGSNSWPLIQQLHHFKSAELNFAEKQHGTQTISISSVLAPPSSRNCKMVEQL